MSEMIRAVVDGLRIEQMHATFRVPAQKVLDRGPDYTLVTERNTESSIFLDADGLRMTFHPPLRFVLHPASAGIFAHLVEDVRWSRARYVFRRPGRPPLPSRQPVTRGNRKTRRDAAQPSVDQFRRSHPSRVEVTLEPVPAWLAFDVARQQVQWLLEEAIEDFFEGQPVSAPDYDPTKDPNLEATLASLAELFAGSGESDGGGAQALRGLGATVRLTQGFSHQESSDTEIRLVAGTSVRVNAGASVSGCDGLLQLRSASFMFSSPLQVRSGANQVEISQARVEITPEGPKVEIQPGWMRATGGAAGSIRGVGALIGLLAGAANGGRGSAHLTHGMVQGGRAGGAVLAGTISGIATRAVATALEHLRPRLKEQAPLVDWDGLFADTHGRPACAQPVTARP